MEKQKKYTCIGSVRGCCGQVHESLDAAERCIDRDARGCVSQGGYSDRRPVSGEDYTYEERCEAGNEIMVALTRGALMSALDLTLVEHLNESPPPTARYWHCGDCGDYAWIWPGEDEPMCSCDAEVRS